MNNDSNFTLAFYVSKKPRFLIFLYNRTVSLARVSWASRKYLQAIAHSTNQLKRVCPSSPNATVTAWTCTVRLIFVTLEKFNLFHPLPRNFKFRFCDTDNFQRSSCRHRQRVENAKLSTNGAIQPQP